MCICAIIWNGRMDYVMYKGQLEVCNCVVYIKDG